MYSIFSRIIGESKIFGLGSVIVVGIALIWQKAEAAMYVYDSYEFHYSNLVDGQNFTKSPKVKILTNISIYMI